MNPLRGTAAWKKLVELRERFGVRSYSQEGEDRVLARYFGSQESGFFVDVGAHHPFRFSNTCLLYQRGWRGVNIDATPGSMGAFARHRPRDVNIEAAVGSTRGTATYYVFAEPALNTFDEELVAQRTALQWKVVKTVSLPVRPLSELLAEVVPAGCHIDLLTVDVEGRDLDVLQSNDWKRFRPTMVLAETLGRHLSDLANDPVVRYLGSLGYSVSAKTLNTIFLIDAAAHGEN